MSIAFRMLHGVGLSFSNSTTATVASDVICRPRFAEGMGYFGMATALASAIAPALGLTLMEGFGFGVLYAVAAAIAGLGLVLFAFVLTRKVEVPKKKLDLRTIINRDSLPATVTMLVFMLTFGALENFVAIFAAQNSLPSGSIYFVVMSVMLLVVRITLGKLVDQRGEAFFVYTCNAAMLAAFLLLAFVPNTVTYILSAALAGYAFGEFDVFVRLRYRLRPGRRPRWLADYRHGLFEHVGDRLAGMRGKHPRLCDLGTPLRHLVQQEPR